MTVASNRTIANKVGAFAEDPCRSVFGDVPEEARPHDGYRRFKKAKGPHLALEFSFDLMEASVQTRVTVNGRAVSTVAHEGLDSIVVDERGSRVRVTFQNDSTVLNLQLGDNVAVDGPR